MSDARLSIYFLKESKALGPVRRYCMLGEGTAPMFMEWIAGGVLMVASAEPASGSISPAMATPAIVAPGAPDRAEISALDIEYQAAVKRGDVATMDRILHPDFILVRGDGRTVTRDEILEGARSGDYVFEQQDELPGTQTVRLWGKDTAVVTALLWVKGMHRDQPFDRRVWFSDTYVRTTAGWRYAFAQVSLPLPADTPAD
jgi:hypothetical protein